MVGSAEATNHVGLSSKRLLLHGILFVPIRYTNKHSWSTSLTDWLQASLDSMLVVAQASLFVVVAVAVATIAAGLAGCLTAHRLLARLLQM
jgi:hypothetical protein